MANSQTKRRNQKGCWEIGSDLRRNARLDGRALIYYAQYQYVTGLLK